MPTRIQELAEPARSFQKSRTFPFYESDLLVDEMDGTNSDRFIVKSTSLELNGDEESLLRNHSPRATVSESTYWTKDKNIPDLLANLDSEKKPAGNRLSTLMGVFFPTMQNIFGVILFIRMSWVVGVCGYPQAFLLVAICCLTTFLTAISMSAVATNGKISAGGSYYMISRNLGPSFGGSVGILFYLGTTFACAMYILGAVEIITKYIAPNLSLNFGSPGNDGFFTVYFNDCRFYGTIILAAMVTIVYVGVKYVNYSANIFLGVTLVSIATIFAGFVKNAAFPSTGPDATHVCLLGPRLLQQPEDERCAVFLNESGTFKPSWIYNQFCPEVDDATFADLFEKELHLAPCHEYLKKLELVSRVPIPGAGNSDDWSINLNSGYMQKGGFVSADAGTFNESLLNVYKNETAERELGDKIDKIFIRADITSSFAILIGIFFPSCTGIMAGSNRSGDLANPAGSIPKGTISAILVTTFCYLSTVILFGISVDGAVLRDKFGQSLSRNNQMLTAKVVWPHELVMLVGCLLSTLGAGLQSLTGAPRLLQSIARDGIIPFLRPVAAGKPGSGEPTWAILVTAVICEVGILIAALDAYIAPLATLFFLMCYMFVNVACALQGFLKSPSWRPTWRYYHWGFSCLGAFLCFCLMWMVGWQLVLVVLIIALFLYKYIAYKGAEAEWGDGLRGLYLSVARYALYQIPQSKSLHTKNYRPQILAFCKYDQKSKTISNPDIVKVARDLKAGKGLSMYASVLEGDILDSESSCEVEECKQQLGSLLREHGCKAFTNILLQKDVPQGMSALMQTSGLGSLKHNSVLISWPRDFDRKCSTTRFNKTLRAANATGLACMVTKCSSSWPSQPIQKGTIDVWWIIHDGGLIMLVAWLLKKSRTWKGCKIRLFAVAQETDNSILLEQRLQGHIAGLRIGISQIKVVELNKQDISAYAYQRTVKMDQRNELLTELGVEDIGRVAEEVRAASAESQNHLEKIALDNNMTWSPTHNSNRNNAEISQQLRRVKFDESDYAKTYAKMHNARALNNVILDDSDSASLVIINLPAPPSNNFERERTYMMFIEALTMNLERVLLIRGSGKEVITAYG